MSVSVSRVISRHTPYDMRLFEKKETLPVVETGGQIDGVIT